MSNNFASTSPLPLPLQLPLQSTSSSFSSTTNGASHRHAHALLQLLCFTSIASLPLFLNNIAAAFSCTTASTTSTRSFSLMDNPSSIQQRVRMHTAFYSSSRTSNTESTLNSSIKPDSFDEDDDGDDDDDDDDDDATSQQPQKSPSPPLWMKCITAVVPPNVRALNEAVSIIANISRSEANELIEIGAVWARMDTLTEEDILGQYYDDNTATTTSSSSLKYADFRAGWGSGDVNDEFYNIVNDKNSSSIESETLDEYIERQLALRYRRILTPSTIHPGTDMRIYPHPRRFPSCYEFSDPYRLLYEDTTFLVVDKPPMLPVQPEPSNYEECCPGCVNLLLGPFHTIGGEVVHRPLICHRVDSCVGGCVVLSKDGNGQRVFSDLQVCFKSCCYVASTRAISVTSWTRFLHHEQ